MHPRPNVEHVAIDRRAEERPDLLRGIARRVDDPTCDPREVRVAPDVEVGQQLAARLLKASVA